MRSPRQPGSGPSARGAVGWGDRLRRLLPSTSTPSEADPLVRMRSTWRLNFVGGGVALGYLLLTAQLANKMLLPDPRLEGRAKVQFEQIVEVDGRRGDILDRNGAVIATTVDLVALHVDPSTLDEDARRDLASLVAPLVGRSAGVINQRLDIPGRRDVLLGRGFTPEEARSLRAKAGAALGKKVRRALWTETEPQRFYPGMAEAAPLIGVVGRRGRGRAGLEGSMEHYLRGERHKYVRFRDRKGRSVTPADLKVEEGRTLVLTLDRRIQHAAELALDEAMERTGAEAAQATVVDVHTGEILAMASRPSQNPNDTSRFSNKKFKNHAALDAFEPGSVFKPFTAAAAINEHLVTPSTTIDCERGAWRVGRTTIHDDHGKGVITVQEVIKFSSNIGAAKLAFRLGAKRELGYLSAFGFGHSTGLGIPGETRGVLRKPETIKPIELATTAYGHGVSASGVQLVMATAALANQGLRMKPLLVREIRDAYGDVVERFEPEEVDQVVRPETARAVTRMMVTVTEKGGTGTRARVPGYSAGGKTGTAWKNENGAYSPTDRIGSFVGFVPGDDPRIAIAVSVDTPTIGLSYGGIVAAPAFSTIGAESMRILGVPPDAPTEIDEHDVPVEDLDVAPHDEPGLVRPELTWAADGSLRLPDLKGLALRDALLTLQGSGLALSMQGSGRVAQQHPGPGARVTHGDRVEVMLR